MSKRSSIDHTETILDYINEIEECIEKLENTVIHDMEECERIQRHIESAKIMRESLIKLLGDK